MSAVASPAVEVTSSHTLAMSWEAARRANHPGLDAYIVDRMGYEERPSVPMLRREVPHGAITVIINLGPPIELVETVRSPTSAQPLTSFAAGLHDGHVIIGSGHQRGIQLDLTPLGAYRLLGLPMEEITAQVVPLDEVRGPSATELIERLAVAPTWEDRFDLLDRQLLAWADEGPEPDREVRWAWNQLARSHGQIAVGPLVEETGWSHRHFVTRFRQQVGLPPKPTGRVLRFQRALALLRAARPGTTITDVAAICGYADHSHLVREFRALAGCPPSTLLAAQLPEDLGVDGSC